MPSQLQIDLTGKTFGRLMVLAYVPGSRRNPSKWECKCICGATTLVSSGNLRSGGTQSCGCLKSELITNSNTKHGDCGSRLYWVWAAIKDRCLNPHNRTFERYGGRGISMFPAWINDYATFRDFVLRSLGPKPTPRHSLDRINNAGNYEPGNLRWADDFQQAANRRPRTNPHKELL